EVADYFRRSDGALTWPSGLGPVATFGRDKKSGTTKLFRDFVGIPKDLPLMYSGVPEGQPGHEGYESTSQIVDQVRQTKGGMGFVGRAANLPATVKAIAIRPATGYSAFAPTRTTIQTMEYPMARELYLYTAQEPRSIAGDFIKFTLSPEGQRIADEAGF